MLLIFIGQEESYQWQIIQALPADLPEGKDLQMPIHTLVGIILQLDSSDKLALDRDYHRGNHPFIVFERLLFSHSGQSRVLEMAPHDFHCLSLRNNSPLMIKDSFIWLSVLLYPNKLKRKTENGLFCPLVVPHIPEFHSKFLHVSANFKGKVYLWTTLLYFKRTRDHRRFLGLDRPNWIVRQVTMSSSGRS